MKKLISCIILAVILSSFCSIEVHAAHQHSDSCYTIQGAHSHSGDSTNGGGCYTTPIYHVHSGNSTSGGGCYTKLETYYTSSHCGQFADFDGDGIYNCMNCGSSCAQAYLPGNNEHAPQTMYTAYVTECGKTEETVESWGMDCGKTEETVESWEMGCGLQESAGTRVLTCTTPESVDIPAPAPTPEPTPAPSAPAVTTPEKPKEETPEEEISVDDFDFRVECELVDDGASVKIIPNNKDILADIPYSWDNGISWNNSDTSIFSKNGTYYIAIKNTEGKIKYKKLDIDLKSTNFAVITEYAATLTDKEYIDIIKEEETPAVETEVEIEEPVKKNSSAGKVFAIIGIIIGCLLLMGGIGYLVFMLIFKSNAKVIDSESGETLAKISLKKKGGKTAIFEANISDKILISLEGAFTIQPDSSIVNKYVGYTLMVKSSQGIVETEIAESIDVDF